jgi:hypothetical protein
MRRAGFRQTGRDALFLISVKERSLANESIEESRHPQKAIPTAQNSPWHGPTQYNYRENGHED